MISLLLALSAHAADLSLEERVRKLEIAVAELQGKKEAPVIAKGVACELRTPFDGTFRASEPTEKASREAVLARCKADAKGSLYCTEAAVECGKK